MANNIKGITIEFDGKVSKLQKALGTVKKASSDTFNELNKINKGLKFNPSNVELLAMKQKKLQDRVKETADKLDLLRQADEKAKAQLAKGDLSQDEYNKLRREIIETESKLKHFKKEAESLPNVKIEALGAKFEQVGKKLQQVGDKVTSLGKSLTTKLTLPLTGVGAVAYKNAAELEDAMGATEQIFGSASDSMKDWANSIEGYYGIAEGEALEYSNTMGAMLQNIGGLSEAEAAKQAQTLTKLAGNLSAMFGGSTQDAINALTGALKGNNTMLDNYGMGVNDATIKAKAFEMGLYSGTGAMDLQTKQAATLALIMEQTAAAQGQASREAEGASGSMKSLKTEVTNLATDIGQVLLPIITPMIQKISDWVAKFKELSPETQSMIVKIGLIAAAVGPLLLVLGTLITTIGSVSTALGGLMTFVSANPMVLIAAGVAVAVGLIIANWDKIKAKTTEVWNGIKATVSNAVNSVRTTISNVFNSIKSTVSNIWNGIKNTTTNVWNGIKTTVSNVVNGVKSTVTNVFTGLKNTVTNIWNGIKLAIMTPINAAKNVVKGAIDSIKNMFNFTFKWPKLPMPHFSIRGSMDPLKWLSEGVPKLSVDWYAQGGIFDRPSVIGVGEAGQEAVLPTHKLDKFLDEAVKRVSGQGQGQGSGITINIENAVVREESDIRRIAEEVNRLFEVKKNRLRSAGGIA